MSEVFQASRVPSGEGFPATIKYPQPDGMRLTLVSTQAAMDIEKPDVASGLR